MTPKEQVITRELAVELKATGVPQESYWVWLWNDLTHEYMLDRADEVPSVEWTAAAFTTGELIALLGDDFLNVMQFKDHTFGSGSRDTRLGYGTTPQEALGRLLLAVWVQKEDL